VSTVGKAVRKIGGDHHDAYRCQVNGELIRVNGRRFGNVSQGWEGTVISEEDNGSIRVVVYADPGNPGQFYRIRHQRRYENSSYEFIDKPTTASMTIEHERSYALYVAASSEDIKGFVPQVRYREEIVWQGEPVPTTDDSGEAIGKSEQSTNALKAAEAKIQEVVKKQFS